METQFFLKINMQQGQTYIPIVGFPDPNYGIKAVNQNKLLSPIVSSPLAPLYAAQRLLSFSFFSLNAKLYIPNQRKFSINFKNKFNYNIWGQLPLSKQKGLRGVSSSTTKRRHFEILTTPM